MVVLIIFNIAYFFLINGKYRNNKLVVPFSFQGNNYFLNVNIEGLL